MCFFQQKRFFRETGFTVIELIVVIAIMAVLATIVASNIVSYVAKSKDAAIKGNMHSIASGATVFFDNEKKWNNVFNSSNNPSIFAAMNAINKIIAPNGVSYYLSSNNSSWCVCCNLVSRIGSAVANTYCIDSAGYRKETTGPCYGRCGSPNGFCVDIN